MTEWVARRDGFVPGDVRRLLAALPEWFGLHEVNEEYSASAHSKETWTVRDEHGKVRGVTLIDRHYSHVVEIHLTAVDLARHGQGIGTAMLQAIEDDARARDVRLMQVKTLGPSHPDPGYARTREFYENRGFLPLEETNLWGEDNPCLIMVKPL